LGRGRASCSLSAARETRLALRRVQKFMGMKGAMGEEYVAEGEAKPGGARTGGAEVRLVWTEEGTSCGED